FQLDWVPRAKNKVADTLSNDAMDAAFREYTTRMLDREKTPSMLKKLHRMVELAKSIPGKVRHKEQEHSL
ncbi:MAG: hypothetical protein PUI44_10890, partial [Firmicutes bacterium]|nr:hypothetical protein [Bacillota bacterium]